MNCINTISVQFDMEMFCLDFCGIGKENEDNFSR